MVELIRLLRESLPEAIGGLAAAAVLAILGLLYRRLSRRKKERITDRDGLPQLTTSTEHQSAAVQSDNKQTILIVDDDIEFIAPMFRPLEEEGYELIAATNVSQAIGILQSEQQIGLIVTDIILPRKDEKAGESRYSGLKVIEAARQLRGDIPIICLSVVSSEKVGDQLQELDVTEHLIKPVRPREVTQRVKLALLLSQEPPRQELIADEISRRKLELRSGYAHTRIRALWALGELGHHDPTVLDILEEMVTSDDDSAVRKAAMEAMSKVRTELSSQAKPSCSNGGAA
jgi:CheY-like chemotaxis protein